MYKKKTLCDYCKNKVYFYIKHYDLKLCKECFINLEENSQV